MNKYLTIQIHFFIILLFLPSLTNAEENATCNTPYSTILPLENNTTTCEYNTTIDKIYRNISKKVITYSEYLDTYISSFMGNESIEDQTCLVPNIGLNTYTNADSFFQNNRYLNDTRDIYIRLRLDNYVYTHQSNKVTGKISAQLPFDRCKKQWKIYIDDSSTQKDEIKATDTYDNGVGIRYYRKEKNGIDSSYSIGLTRMSPYFRMRYRLPFEYKSWLIEPIQTFKYSHQYFFEEETNIYFDKYLTKKQLFRIQLHQKTASIIEGRDYGIIFQYYIHSGKDAGLEFTQSFFGNTHYNNLDSTDTNYKGINNYVTSISWRENIWRKWLYYEISPSVNFHKDNNYEASYSLRFLIDIYFGVFH